MTEYLLCTTCAGLIEYDDELEFDRDVYEDVCPNGFDHKVMTLEEASDMINDYERLRKDYLELLDERLSIKPNCAEN